jgi:hypothetical protein
LENINHVSAVEAVEAVWSRGTIEDASRFAKRETDLKSGMSLELETMRHLIPGKCAQELTRGLACRRPAAFPGRFRLQSKK